MKNIDLTLAKQTEASVAVAVDIPHGQFYRKGGYLTAGILFAAEAEWPNGEEK